MATNGKNTVSATTGTDDTIKCSACTETITSSGQKISCGHVFHKSCLEKSIKTRPYCPICNVRIGTDPSTPSSSQVTTRSQSKQANSHTSSGADHINTNENSGNNFNIAVEIAQSEQISQLVADSVSAQQEQMLAALSVQMTQLIEHQVSARLASLMPSTSPHNRSQHPPPSPQQMPTLPAVEEQTLRDLLGIGSQRQRSNGPQERPLPSANGQSSLNESSNTNSSSSDLSSRPDKVLQIMSNWKLKFNGGLNGLSVGNFIYRVEALTSQTLHGSYDLLCGNASSLFDGKANDWFWRYHRSVDHIRWNDLCRALRDQYQDSRTDVDIRELIRERKQKANESFDSFYDSIVALTDRLKAPLSDGELVEILRRNLLPEIQHEILNIEIKSLQVLRDTCRRREFFMQDMRRKHGLTVSKPVPLSKRIFEVDIDEVEFPADVVPPTEELSALHLVCWNCGKGGHRYQDCLEERTVFCYGCGTPKVYKPNCAKCLSKNGRMGAQKSAQSSLRTQNPE
ncbi:uncharacterized protein [Musca autumnalis]|uniref:uncharacterized protein n=1 Tax=Musca autumnalis TaxID=221902 RepID=UPI003CE7B6CC